jgi:hypothetical protein
MSDGNFNRALLPKNELSAGIRAGKAQMRAKAEQAFIDTLAKFFPELSEGLKADMKEHFMQMMRSK